MTSLVDRASALSAVAAEQGGLVTSAQAATVGVTPLILSRLTEKGLLDRVSHGVYAFSVSPDLNRTIRGEWLALAPDVLVADRLRDPSLGVVSHTSAAVVHDLGDFVEPKHEFTMPRRRQSRRAIRIHRGDLNYDDVSIVDGMLVTTPQRTVADLVSDSRDLEHVSRVVRDALRRDHCTVQSIETQLDRIAPQHGFRDGHTLMELLMEIAGIGPDGRFRTTVAHD